jgi:hypothetical protein
MRLSSRHEEEEEEEEEELLKVSRSERCDNLLVT